MICDAEQMRFAKLLFATYSGPKRLKGIERQKYQRIKWKTTNGIYN